MRKKLLICSVFKTRIYIVEVVTVKIGVSVQNCGMNPAVIRKRIVICDETVVVLKLKFSAQTVVYNIKVFVIKASYADSPVEYHDTVYSICYLNGFLHIIDDIERRHRVVGAFYHIDSDTAAHI